MKQTITILAILFSLSAEAQIPVNPIYHIDTARGMIYANIVPQTVSYLGNDVQATRLYVGFRGHIPGLFATIYWGLYYANIVDANTTNYLELIGSTIQVATPQNLYISQAGNAAILYVRDSVYYNGNKVNFTIAP